MGGFRPIANNTTIVKFKVNASTAVVEGDPVIYTVSGGLLTTAGNNCTTGIIGIAAASAAVSTMCPVYMDGVFAATSAFNFAPGDPVYIASSSSVDDGSMADVSVGRVVNTDPAATGEVQFVLTPSRVTANDFYIPITHA